MKSKEEKKYKVFYLKLVLLMAISDKAFDNYLGSKLYIHALCIRKNNRSVYRHITKNAELLPAELKQNFVELLNHYDIWMTQFAQFEKNKQFELNEPFVFFHLDDKSSFPKQAVAAIISHGKSLT